MYVVPNSDIMLIRGCPFDLDYENTGYFVSPTAQQNYFQSLNPTILSEYYYQRKDRGYIRVGLPYSQCYNINYMCFKNTSFENKWWYAFVDSVEYINDGVTELHYVIDVIQSWNQVFRLTQCFVERQHSLTDSIGDNIIPEDVDAGEYVYNNYDELVNINGETLGDLCVVVAVCDTSRTTVEGNSYDGVYGGATLYAFPFETQADIIALDTWLATYIQRPEAILGIYVAPKMSVLGVGGQYPANHALGFTPANNGTNFTLNPIVPTDGIDGYTPRNNKLYTFPYNYLQIDNSTGANLKLRYEYFENNTPHFLLQGNITQPVEMRIAPVSYKNAGNLPDGLNPARGLYAETLGLTNYPMCSWNMDSFKAWIAQESIPSLINIGASLIPSASHFGGALVSESSSNSEFQRSGGDIVYSSNKSSFQNQREGTNWNVSTGGLIGAVANTLNKGYRAAIAADMFQGNLNSGNLNIATGQQIFHYGRVSCKRQFAKMIDDFFTMFGYADKTLHVPNMHTRERWTYVKTVGCHLDGAIPNDDKNLIQNIFDRGIRFWVNPSEIGNYALSNNVLS